MLAELTRKVRGGEDLSREESELALEEILRSESSDEEIARFLLALARKGEAPQELCGFASVMRRKAVPVRVKAKCFVDTAGTGGGADTFNISTTAAFLIAGAGVPVAKHGNRAVTSRSGSADVLSALGVPVELPVDRLEVSLEELGIAFFFAPSFHPAMARVAPIRQALGRRTIFNLLGPLTNPAGAPYQIIGVFAREVAGKVAEAARDLGVRRAWVVHSDDGMDELSVGARSLVVQVDGERVQRFEFDPESFGFEPFPPSALVGGTPEQNALIIRGILEGRVSGPRREVVILNAAAALYVAEAGSFEECLRKARESLESGAALEKLEALRELAKKG